MVDAESVLRRLERLGELLELLEETRREGRARLLGDRRTQLQVEHALQVSIQICIDVGAHLIAELGAPVLDDYRGVFAALHRAGVLEAELADTLAAAAGLPNVLVHEYLDVDLEQLWLALERLEDLRAYAAAVERALA